MVRNINEVKPKGLLSFNCSNLDQILSKEMIRIAWGIVRQSAYERQEGLCSICRNPLPRRFVCHHIVNAQFGGKCSLDNCECRCQNCEIAMHLMYRHGNYDDPPQNNKSNKRTHKKHGGYRKMTARKVKYTVTQIEWQIYASDGVEIAYYLRKIGERNGSLRSGQKRTGYNSQGRDQSGSTDLRQRTERVLSAPPKRRKARKVRVHRRRDQRRHR